MEEYIKWLENKIEVCLEDKDLQREHCAFCQALKKYRELALTIGGVVRTLVCVDDSIPNLTESKEYIMLAETNRHYNLIDDNGNDVIIGKKYMRELKQAN
jgi:hypothetical protein